MPSAGVEPASIPLSGIVPRLPSPLPLIGVEPIFNP